MNDRIDRLETRLDRLEEENLDLKALLSAFTGTMKLQREQIAELRRENRTQAAEIERLKQYETEESISE